MTRNALIRKIRHKSTMNPFTIAGALIILLTCVPMCFTFADSDALVLFRNSIRGGMQNYSVVSVFGDSSEQTLGDSGLTDTTPEAKLKKGRKGNEAFTTSKDYISNCFISYFYLPTPILFYS